MPAFRRFLSRRWLFAYLGAAAILLGLSMLHPYPRQSLFGPTIHGKPWCYWEEEIRYLKQREKIEESLTAKMMRWMGIRRAEILPEDLFSSKDFMPLLLELAEDKDRDIRVACLHSFSLFNELQNESTLPVLYRRLDDDDADCRIYAARALWRINRDRKVIAVMQRELDDFQHHDPWEIPVIPKLLEEVCDKEPEVFSIFVPYAKNPNIEVRCIIMRAAVRAVDKKGVSVLTRIAHRVFCLRSAGELGCR